VILGFGIEVLTAVKMMMMMMMMFWVLAPCRLVEITNVSEKNNASIFWPGN
jgi:hypothetical protein